MYHFTVLPSVAAGGSNACHEVSLEIALARIGAFEALRATLPQRNMALLPAAIPPGEGARPLFLKNRGNTCFLNACMQVLRASRLYPDELLRSLADRLIASGINVGGDVDANTKMHLACICKFMAAKNQGDFSEEDLEVSVQSLHKMGLFGYRGDAQFDAHEYLGRILGLLKEHRGGGMQLDEWGSDRTDDVGCVCAKGHTRGFDGHTEDETTLTLTFAPTKPEPRPLEPPR